jgi:hypothetical protein
LKEYTFPITQSAGLHNVARHRNLPMPAFAVRRNCTAAIPPAAEQDVGGRACRS